MSPSPARPLPQVAPGEANQQISTSNETVKTFLGGHQPSWMSAGQLPPRAAATGRVQDAHGAAKRKRSGPRIYDADGAAGNSTTEQQSAMNSPRCQDVLPSPAPTDEPSPAVSAFNDSPRLATRHYGDNAQGQRLPVAEETSQHPAWTSTSVQNQPLGGQATNNEPPAQTLPPISNLRQTNTPEAAFRNLAPRPNPVQPSHYAGPGTQAQTQQARQQATASGGLPPLSEVMNQDSAHQASIADQYHHKRPRLYNQASSALHPDDGYFWAKCVELWHQMLREHITRSNSTGYNINTGIERTRYVALEEACMKGDIFYLFLHQLYCLWSLKSVDVAETLCRFYEVRPEAVEKAFRLLSIILKQNKYISPYHLQWLSLFPHTFPDGANVYPFYNTTMAGVARFLLYLSSNWDPMVGIVQRRGYPFLVYEITTHLQCPSPLLQSRIFTISRWKVGFHDNTTAEVNDIFFGDQAWEASPIAAGTTDAGRNARRERVVQAYMSLMARVQQHAVHPNDAVSSSFNSNNAEAIPQYSANGANSTPYTQRESVIHPQVAHGPTQTGVPGNRSVLIPPAATPLASNSPQNQNLGSIPSSPLPQNMLPPQPNRMQHHADSRTYSQSPVTREQQLPPGHRGPSPAQRASITPRPQTQSNSRQPPLAPQPAPAYAALPGNGPPRDQRQRIHTIAGTHPPGVNSRTRSHAGPQRRDPVNYRRVGSVYRIPVNEYPRSPYDQSSYCVGLHMFASRSPKRTHQNMETGRFYQFFHSFAVSPMLLKPQLGLRTLAFDLSKEDLELCTKTIESSSPPQCLFREGSLRYRLRVCMRPSSESAVRETDWAISATHWPEHMFVRFNAQLLQLPRKQHFRKDQPIELTDHLLEGENKAQISFPNLPSNVIANHDSVVAIEVIETRKHDSLRASIEGQRLHPDETKRNIRNRLSPSYSDDVIVADEILTLAFTDPFSSRLFEIPVRGVDCKHLECFDLETWLQTRPSKPVEQTSHTQQGDEPCLVDMWKCPICGLDARPPCLRVDEYLLDIRQKLRQGGRENTKKVTFTAEGEWTPVEFEDTDEQEDSDNDVPLAQLQKSTSQRPQSNRRSDVDSGVIVIDDD